ncbi:jg7401 [Pararge aegeria aegeria]|uniref:Jg7401 protein n=1 Tax=Pararge aegeria aegeria TaxID=348720 RepID=A0A8S4RT61_9NEOP|nr:jg7401 [Pararge aegeria aegeria]
MDDERIISMLEDVLDNSTEESNSELENDHCSDHISSSGIFKGRHWGDFTQYIQSNVSEFFLRLLLVNVPGPTSFEFLRTVNGRVFNKYQDACRELQLLEDDNYWDLRLLMLR